MEITEEKANAKKELIKFFQHYNKKDKPQKFFIVINKLGDIEISVANGQKLFYYSILTIIVEIVKKYDLNFYLISEDNKPLIIVHH
jgi:hypothetical protein